MENIISETTLKVIGGTVVAIVVVALGWTLFNGLVSSVSSSSSMFDRAEAISASTVKGR
ncbi:hypothetical protein N5D45_06690 [Stenotrophomonas sp. GD03819]|uniref:hypothetical protein n=1 Tax=Stenotrophomonas TaxID=40323 RepID=UPI0012B0E20B|nr:MULTISPECIES: hypothetical protein [Stenotrophomonas]MCD5965527.1 hypothetical protein [Stenotrophomonas maltophilia]MDH1791506.1 hypothetical protein [Stenotrophomonas sp. GD03819]HEL2981950.1 hypothetical protein [Stenotrophomonas maltophilia]HEL4163127.1 hypothetical protein [Stenotrophomonas maltophilia]